MPYFEKT